MLLISQTSNVETVAWDAPVSLAMLLWYLHFFLDFRPRDPIDHLLIEVR